MDIDTLVTIGGIFLLLVLSGFFSGSETALTAASQPRMHLLQQQGDTRAGIVARLFSQREKMIGAILLGNNLVNILASALATRKNPHLCSDTKLDPRRPFAMIYDVEYETMPREALEAIQLRRCGVRTGSLTSMHCCFLDLHGTGSKKRTPSRMKVRSWVRD